MTVFGDGWRSKDIYIGLENNFTNGQKEIIMARRYYIDTLRNIDGGTMAEGWHTKAKTEACSSSRQRQMIAKGWQQCWPKEIKQHHFPEHMIALSMGRAWGSNFPPNSTHPRSPYVLKKKKKKFLTNAIYFLRLFSIN